MEWNRLSSLHQMWTIFKRAEPCAEQCVWSIRLQRCLPDGVPGGYNSDMSKQPPKPAKRIADGDGPEDEGASSFAWEFGNDDTSGNRPISTPRLADGATARRFRRDVDRQAGDGSGTRAARPEAASSATPPLNSRQANPQGAHPRRTTTTVLPTAGAFGPARANYIRDQLDRALDRWWAAGEMPPLLLLRDGLLLLEAGGSASESQRTLLLRAALAYDKGVQTALRHQVDAERVALVLAETLVEWEVPLEPGRLPSILAGDEQVQALLVAELERSRILLTGEARRRAQEALQLLPRPVKSRPVKTGTSAAPPPLNVAAVNRGRRPLRQVLLILLLVALVGFVLWQQRQSTPTGMVEMPAASYALLNAEGAATSIKLDTFLIDRFEITNRQYRSCVEKNECEWPVSTNSKTHTDYFTNPAFDGYPVVNVTQAMAASYCAAEGKRLPTAGEWQAAAAVSTTTGQAYRYPWGQGFDPQRANSLVSGNGDTLVVGAFRPAGDSASGLADMAGNVAEWTATLTSDADGTARAIVKGGSFLSDELGVSAGAEEDIQPQDALPQVGFRCAKSHLLTNS